MIYNIVAYASGDQRVTSEMHARDTRVCVWEVKARCGDGGACDAYVYGMLSSLTLWGHMRAFRCVYMHAMQPILLMVRLCASHVIYSSLDSLLLPKVWKCSLVHQKTKMVAGYLLCLVTLTSSSKMHVTTHS